RPAAIIHVGMDTAPSTGAMFIDPCRGSLQKSGEIAQKKRVTALTRCFLFGSAVIPFVQTTWLSLRLPFPTRGD
ncbi:MAG: hypothetical protein ACT4PQ_05730, partial [Betaproteobacteria bacterium]